MLYKLLVSLTILTCCSAIPPSNYVKKIEPDKYPPKYEYAYDIGDNKGSGQGKQETRDGVFSLGRYYVQLGDSTQNVEYITDEWGYHPLVQYSTSNGDHSHTSASFALGEKAVQAFRKNKQETSNEKGRQFKYIPPLEQLLPTAQPSQTPVNYNNQYVPNTIQYYFQPLQTHYLNNAPYLQQSSTFIHQQQNNPETQFIFPIQNNEQNIQLHSEKLLAQNSNEIKLNVDQNKEIHSIQILLPNENSNQVQNKSNLFTYIEREKVNDNDEVNTLPNNLTNIPSKYDGAVKDDDNKHVEEEFHSANVFNNGQYLIELLSSPNQNSGGTQANEKYFAQSLVQYITPNDDELIEQQYKNKDTSNDEQSHYIERNTAVPLLYSSLKHNISNLNKQNSDYDESILLLDNGEFGSRIIKSNISTKPVQNFNKQLIDRTKNLVNGIDVLNINDAIKYSVSSSEEQSDTISKNVYQPNVIFRLINEENESTNYNSGHSEFWNHHQTEKSISTSHHFFEDNQLENNKKQHINITTSLATQPIVVAELDNFQQVSDDYSTTQNTIETKIPDADDTTSTTESSIIIRPRPVVSNTFLAPITAALHFKNKTPDLNGTREQVQNDGVPYYLGIYRVNEESVEKSKQLDQVNEEAYFLPRRAEAFIENEQHNVPDQKISTSFKNNVISAVPEKNSHVNNDQIPIPIIIPLPMVASKIAENPITKYLQIPFSQQIPVQVQFSQPPIENHGLQIPYPLQIPQRQYQQQPPFTYQNDDNFQFLNIPLAAMQTYTTHPDNEKKFVYAPSYHHQYASKYPADCKNIKQCFHGHMMKNRNLESKVFFQLPPTSAYIGLVPPVIQTNAETIQINNNNHSKRKARNSFDQNLRIEYGFKPPIQPSIQTDEFGKPLDL